LKSIKYYLFNIFFLIVKRSLSLDAVILNSTHTSKANAELINDLVGKPFSFLERLQLKGVGSKRMMDLKTSYDVDFNSPTLTM